MVFRAETGSLINTSPEKKVHICLRKISLNMISFDDFDDVIDQMINIPRPWFVVQGLVLTWYASIVLKFFVRYSLCIYFWLIFTISCMCVHYYTKSSLMYYYRSMFTSICCYSSHLAASFSYKTRIFNVILISLILAYIPILKVYPSLLNISNFNISIITF